MAGHMIKRVPQLGMVAYDWPAHHMLYGGAYWERRRQRLIDMMNDVNTSYIDNVPELEQLGERVQNIGKEERKKELMFLSHNLPDFDFTNIKDKELIIQINKIINGKEQFKNALKRIETAIKMGNEQPKGKKRKKDDDEKMKQENFKGLAPTMAALFPQYLGTAVIARARNMSKTLPPDQVVTEWKTNLDSIIDESIDEAITKSLKESYAETGSQDEIYGDARQWREIGEAYDQLNEFQKQFKNMLKQKLNLDSLKNFFDEKKNMKHIEAMRKNRVKTAGLRKALGWTSQQWVNMLGGNVNEYVNILIGEALPKNIHMTEKGGTVITGENIKADALQFYQYSAEVGVDFEQIFNNLADDLSKSVSLKDAAERFEDFYNKNLANLDKNDFFIVYNDKMASLGSGFAGFHNGKELKLERLVDYIDAAGISEDKANDFIYMAYNTLKTAIFADRRQEVEDNIRNILTSAAAKLLFDDWSTIGTVNPGTQMLNFFNIDGIIVPSSVFFIALGKAMVETAENLENGGRNTMKSWFSVYVNLPETVTYKEENANRYAVGATNEETKDNIYKEWQKQADKAREESTFSTKFLFNFKSKVMDLIKNSSID